VGQNYPNPFNPVTTIPFSLADNSHVTLKIFDLQGKVVATVLEGDFSAGQYETTFDASSLSSGIYLYRVEAEGFSKTMKLALMK